MDNYFAKNAASCVIKPCPDGKSKNHPTPKPTKHPWNNHFDRRNLLRVGFDVSVVTVRATSDINVINSAIWRCVLALTATALSSRAAKAVTCAVLAKPKMGLNSSDPHVSFFEKK